MLLRVLFAVFIVVFIRFVLGLVRALARQGAREGRPEVRRGKPDKASPGGGRVIDVDYTEDPGPAREDR